MVYTNNKFVSSLNDQRKEIDAGLARGFTQQLLDWLPKDRESATNALEKKILEKHFYSRQGYEKQIDTYKLEWKKFALSLDVYGSKRKPYVGAVLLREHRGYKYKDWQENSLIGEVIVKTLYEPLDHRPSLGLFFIGQHAITRIYQRAGIVNYSGSCDHYAIVRELKLVPLWSNIWQMILFDIDEISMCMKNMIMPVIPTESGLLLCQLTSINNVNLIQIRSYVHKEQLRADQLELREILMRASRNLEHSAINLRTCLGEISSTTFGQELKLCQSIMYYRLQNEVEKIARLISGKNKDMWRMLSMSIKKHFANIIKEDSIGFELLSQAMEKQGYRRFVHSVIHNKEILMGALVKEYSQSINS